ncbi:hypothetical protein CW360_12045 [Pseudomonas fluvialis]|uniref:Uncharacterized protein n=1 Tax=Pseudomonas fluvialis TaxID=1793966 RepID=A0A2I0CNG9_9PSED|nr:hypothetical protein CW360_12045 [Pseudomonas pharmacofabricae]
MVIFFERSIVLRRLPATAEQGAGQDPVRLGFLLQGCEASFAHFHDADMAVSMQAAVFLITRLSEIAQALPGERMALSMTVRIRKSLLTARL